MIEPKYKSIFISDVHLGAGFGPYLVSGLFDNNPGENEKV